VIFQLRRDKNIERIADYRANDKADPDYYAGHTVGKGRPSDASANHCSGHTISDPSVPIEQPKL
jgi:hypothetical protein